MALILIVDDEPGICEVLRTALTTDGHRALAARSGEEALDLLGREAFDLVITDLCMPGIDGVELLRRVSELAPDTPAIVITAYGSKETAIQAMRHGAVNYLEKPFDIEELRLHVQHALGHRRLSDENRRLRARLTADAELIGTSEAIEKVRDLIARVAPTDSTVLITGESGSGKEIAARVIHRASLRAAKPLVSVNCAAIPADLLESELFGHVRGAFTGADRSRPGLVEAAAGGTLFLDEIGDMSPAMQAKLLRVLQDRRIRRVGGTEEVPVDVRVITATHQDLDALVRAGRFREDLYYRIHVINVRMPALRERLDDIPDFVRFFVDRWSARTGRAVRDVEPAFLAALARSSWPGNIRELQNVLERALTLTTSDCLSVQTLPAEIGGGFGAPLSLPEHFDLEGHLDQQRRQFMEAALAAAGGVQTRAAERLGMTFRSFRYFAKKFELVGRSAESAEAGAGVKEETADPTPELVGAFRD